MIKWRLRMTHERVLRLSQCHKMPSHTPTSLNLFLSHPFQIEWPPTVLNAIVKLQTKNLLHPTQGWHRPVSSVVQGLRTDGTRFYRVKSSSNSRLSSVRWAQDESRRLSGPFGRDETISYRTKNGRGRHRTRDGRNRRNRIEQWCHRVMSRDMVHYMWKLNMFCDTLSSQIRHGNELSRLEPSRGLACSCSARMVMTL